jgi:hypothetical protein
MRPTTGGAPSSTWRTAGARCTSSSSARGP